MDSLQQWWQGHGLESDWKVGKPLPLARLESAVAEINDKLYVCGGFIRNLRTTKRVDVYDPVNEQWQRLADMPSPVTHVNAAIDGNTIWIAGGFVGTHPGPVTDQVWQYDTARDQWESGISLPAKRGGGSLCCVGRSLFYFGGFASDRDTTCDDCWEFPLDGGNRWLPRSPFPKARGHVASVVYDNKVYAIGGQYRHDTRPKDQASVHVYDPKQDRWQQLADLPEPRSHVEPATFLVNHHIVIVGGKNSCLPLPIHINPKDIFYRINRKLNNLYSAHQIVKKITAYDIQNDRWLDLRELPESLNAPTARFMQNQLFVTGGGATSGYNTRCRTLLNETLLDAISQVD